MEQENRNKIRRHAEFISASSTQVVLQDKQQRQAWKTLKHCNQTPDKDLPGRGQAVKAAVQGDDLVCYNGKNAFTLIELLVVVLIIGILAAVAVPQYQKAVWKSRYTQAKVLAKTIANAEEAYYLANGQYTTDFETLSIDLPATSFNNAIPRAYFSWGYCGLYNVDGRSEVTCTLTKNGKSYLKYWLGFSHSVYLTDRAACLAFGTSGKPAAGDINYQICKSDTNCRYADSWGDTTYGWDYNK